MEGSTTGTGMDYHQSLRKIMINMDRSIIVVKIQDQSHFYQLEPGPTIMHNQPEQHRAYHKFTD